MSRSSGDPTAPPKPPPSTSSGSTSCSAHRSRTSGTSWRSRRRCRIAANGCRPIPFTSASRRPRKPGTPALMAPCAGSVDVFVTNLEGGCLLKVTYKGKTYRGTVPPSAALVRLSFATADRDRNNHRAFRNDAGWSATPDRRRSPGSASCSGCCRTWWNHCSDALASSARGRCRRLAAGLGQNASRPDTDQQSDICDE